MPHSLTTLHLESLLITLITSGLSQKGSALYVCNILWLYHGESSNVDLMVHLVYDLD